MNFAAAGLAASLLLALVAPAYTTELPPGVIEASDKDPVRIASLFLSSRTLHAGDVVVAQVVTTSNAAAVTARVGTYRVGIPKIQPGIFQTALVIPNVPHVMRAKHEIVFTAIRTDGATTSRSLTIDLR